MLEPLFIGIDVGTSGCRAVAIDAAATPLAESRTTLPEPIRTGGSGVEQDPELWWDALTSCLESLLDQVDRRAVRTVAVDGTSGTVLVTDTDGHPLHPALLYNDGRARGEAERIATVADRNSAAHGVNGGLAKLLWLLAHGPKPARVHAPADWFAARLTGRAGRADANSMLKLGWDAVHRRWPAWLEPLGVPHEILPQVVDPGTPLGPLAPAIAAHFGLPADTLVVAGTSDSTAAILATGAREPGDAVTSLGSTLVTKVVAERPVFAPEYGVYSQPLGARWLVGGGSNSGGAVLLHFFTPERLAELTERLDPAHPTGLDYYPLPAPGERFPVNDPNLAPRLEPRPADDVRFLQALLEGMAAIEVAAYRKLAELGAPWPTRVFSVGGGATNAGWSAIRAKALGVPLQTPRQTEAAYGAALLARAAMLR